MTKVFSYYLQSGVVYVFVASICW